MYHRRSFVGQEIFEPERPPAPAARGPEVMPWDPSGQVNPYDPVAVNRGCPVGYVAQFVAPGSAAARDYGTPGVWIRCRLQATITAETIKRESGTSVAERLNIASGAFRQTLAELPERLPRLVTWGLIVAAGVAGVAGALAGVLGGRR